MFKEAFSFKRWIERSPVSLNAFLLRASFHGVAEVNTMKRDSAWHVTFDLFFVMHVYIICDTVHSRHEPVIFIHMYCNCYGIH